MTENETKVTEASVKSYLAAVPGESRKKDCRDLSALIGKATGTNPKMWEKRIVGCGSRRHKYESGREGDTCIVGFASCKSDIAIYGLGTIAAQQPELMTGLGKFKMGKGCLYLSRLSDMDARSLAQLVARNFPARQVAT